MAATKQFPTKISIPRVHQAYQRTRLFEQIDIGRQQSIVWIAGPPGSGKTTLVSSYCASRSLRTLWYQLDKSDSDIASFFHYLTLGLKAASPRMRKPLPKLTPEYLPGIMTFTQRFFETVGSRLSSPAVIVLDNYQEVSNTAALHEVLREAAQNLPSGLSFLVLSREEPPASLSRLQLHGELILLGWNELRLTLDEAKNIAKLRLPAVEVNDHVEMLHKQTEGWVAGLRLLLDQGENIHPHTQLIIEKKQQVLFDYFAAEVFERWSPAIQTALLRTALLPVITVPHAQQLTKEDTIGDVLADLHRRNYFVVQHKDKELHYEYHALFREFLLNRSQKNFSKNEWQLLQQQAANILTQANNVEAAIPLYHASQDWSSLESVLLQEAAGLIAAGRHQTLLQWLDLFPEKIFESSPWLLYWRGLARLPFNPVEARRIFEQAYYGFQAEDNASGLYLSWAGLMDSFFFEWRDFTPVDHWIAEFEQLRVRHSEFPSRAIELRTYWSIGTLMHRQPQHPFLRTWSQRGLALLDIADRDLSILLGGYLIVCFLWWGETAKAREIIERLKPWTQSVNISPLVYILWSCALALYHSVRGEMDACVSAVEEGLKLAQHSGLHAFDFLLRAQAARCSLMAGKLSEAENWLSLMAKAMRSHSHIDGTFYQHLLSNAAAQRGDWLQAIEHARTGLAMSIQAGAPFPEAHCRIDLARALIGQGKHEEWEEHLHSAAAIGEAIGSRVLEYLCIETAAIAAFKQGYENTGLELLAKALAISRAMGGATWLLEGPKVNADLYNRALTAGIEVDHVQRVIRQRKLIPADLAAVSELWPWPVRVYTLGKFEVLCNDQSLHSSRKTQHKPLQLLKCLCALGGYSINQDLITETLWPDAEGDAAEQALNTTLHRLRKLLQYEQVIRMEDRHLSLDPNYIWVDCMEFDRVTRHLNLIDRVSLQRTLSHYHGHFLKGESSSWVLNFRESLRAQHKKMVEQLGIMFERDNNWLDAIECYLTVLEIEPLTEFFYYRLMQCYMQLGRRTEALATYQRCRQSLLTWLDLSPSQETISLYHELMNN